ncbi:MAG: GTPase ObgE [Actinomycetota bacterium]|jgi:GTP-binding protein
MVSFVDEVRVFLRAGSGGDGCTSIRREKFKPLAGPDGADGGDGGSIFLVADSSESSLIDYHQRPHRTAGAGGKGAGSFKNGERGADLRLPVPVGTVIKSQSGEIIADLKYAGQEFLVAPGGQGGLGNAALASKRRIAPNFHLLGTPGWEGEVTLELKLVADVALVGFPSAGKSSLISVMSAARPKIADYPFTTLHPNLGVVQMGEYRYVIADVPGLIPGAAAGKGLGLKFLRHVERCSAILHVIDTATIEPGREPLADFHAIVSELSQYPVPEGETPLAERPAIIALNKVDTDADEQRVANIREAFENLGFQVHLVSAVTQRGVSALKLALGSLVQQRRSDLTPAPPRISLVREQQDSSFTITKEGSEENLRFRITGAKPERWIAQTDFSNDDAIGYLGERLKKLGIEKELTKQGAVRGDTVIIGSGNGVIFDWEPSVDSLAELPDARRTTQERRAEYHATMDARTRYRLAMEAADSEDAADSQGGLN